MGYHDWGKQKRLQQKCKVAMSRWNLWGSFIHSFVINLVHMEGGIGTMTVLHLIVALRGWLDHTDTGTGSWNNLHEAFHCPQSRLVFRCLSAMECNTWRSAVNQWTVSHSHVKMDSGSTFHLKEELNSENVKGVLKGEVLPSGCKSEIHSIHSSYNILTLPIWSVIVNSQTWMGAP